MWYGWIPVLNSSILDVQRDRPIEASDRFVLLGKETDDPLRFQYIEEDGTKLEIRATVESGFLRMDGLEGMEPRRAYLIMQNLYILLKKSYHVDLTHSPDDGLTVVLADGVEEAAVLVMEKILDNCEDFPLRAGGVLDVETLRAMYLKSLGSIEYGKSFIENYAMELYSQQDRYLQRLTSVSKFIDAIYGTRRDAIQDEVAKQSKRLARSTERLSFVVMALTVSSIILSCSAFFCDHLEIGYGALCAIISVSVIAPAMMIAYAYYHRNTASDRPDGL